MDEFAATQHERSVFWDEASVAVAYVDQRSLPAQHVVARAGSVEALIAAIRSLAVRGAPAIGIAGAYGVALAERLATSTGEFLELVAALRAARPTAINLAWAVDRVAASADRLREAYALHAAQIADDRAIADHALQFFAAGARVITHCHTGALATAGEGTALGAIIAAHRLGKLAHVYVDETRPLLQGARLTMWELNRAGVPATLLVDGAAASLMASGRINFAIVGADRIARNRDTANKIGTYGLAVAARYHELPFYVAAPSVTFDASLATGSEIVVEERASGEVQSIAGVRVCADGAVYNPAFDVTPGSLITAIITESGIA